MSKGNGPIERLWNGALLILGAALAIYFSLTLIEKVWGFILLILGIAAVVAGAIIGLRWWWSNRSNRW